MNFTNLLGLHCLLITWLISVGTLNASTITRVKVIGVADGDTITVLQNNKQYKVRLYGIDCPESGQAYGKNAKQFTSSLVYGKTVELTPYDVDRYKRIVAVVKVNGINVNEAIIRNGYAWRYTKYCQETFCDDWGMSEYAARNSRLGLWKENSAMPPWEWRHNPQKQKLAVRNKTGRERQKQKYQTYEQTDKGETVHGNVKSHKYHNVNCRYYSCKNCSRTFGSATEARNAGYSPCQICN